MPMKPHGPCRQPGCPRLGDAGEGYCAQHRREVRARLDRERGSAASRGYDSRWAKARAGFLRQHPLCAECERRGRLTPATVVDHVLPHRGDRELFWTSDNWQALCAPCHDSKTAREDGRWGGVK